MLLSSTKIVSYDVTFVSDLDLHANVNYNTTKQDSAV